MVMKKATGGFVVLVAAVAACRTAKPAADATTTPPPVADATKSVRWRGNFETGDLLQWSYLLNPRGLSIVPTPAAEGKHAARVEIGPGDLWPNGLNRVEIEHKPPRATVAEGQRSCFAWKFFLPATLSEARHQIGYWESTPSYRQIMSFEVRGQGIVFVTRLPTERVHWQAAGLVTPEVWHQVAMCTRWSTDATVGEVDVWFDKQQVVTRGAARTLWDNPNFVHIGILRDLPAPTEIMFLDDAMEGASLEAAGIDVSR
jgi:Polysaccharide lyase